MKNHQCSKMWNAVNGEELQTFPHKHIVRACDFGTEQRIVTGGMEKVLRIFNMERPDGKSLYV
jgi:serine-threonine kinase receptor-associated protein